MLPSRMGAEEGHRADGVGGWKTNVELGGNAQELVRMNVAESAHGDTSSGQFGGHKEFGLRKIDS